MNYADQMPEIWVAGQLVADVPELAHDGRAHVWRWQSLNILAYFYDSSAFAGAYDTER